MILLKLALTSSTQALLALCPCSLTRSGNKPHGLFIFTTAQQFAFLTDLMDVSYSAFKPFPFLQSHKTAPYCHSFRADNPLSSLNKVVVTGLKLPQLPPPPRQHCSAFSPSSLPGRPLRQRSNLPPFPVNSSTHKNLSVHFLDSIFIQSLPLLWLHVQCMQHSDALYP